LKLHQQLANPQKGVVAVAGNADIAAIVLAAGESRRMGEANKLHLPVQGVPLLRHSVETLLAANLGEILVVLGHQSADTQALLNGLSVRSVINNDYASGQMTSVHCGLGSLNQAGEGVIIALGDQPALTVDDVTLLVDTFFTRDGGEVVVPLFDGKRGNPIIISSRCQQEIVYGKYNLGCRSFIENNPELVRTVDMGPSVVIDLDTPTDYHRYCDSDPDPSDTVKLQQAN
jgi:molybdenum cofactor cytidylyltransferase